MITPTRSLHHLSAPTLEALEREVLRMNLITQRTSEIFQVTKIGKAWFAFFHMEARVYSDYILAIRERGK